MADLCTKTELPRQACAHCTLAGLEVSPSTDTALRDSSSRSFTARYDGHCSGCGFDIDAGDHVRFVNDRLVHADGRGCDR